MIHLLKLGIYKAWHGWYCVIIVATSAPMATESMLMDKATRADEFMYHHLQAQDDLTKMFSRQQIVDLRTKGAIELSDYSIPK